MCAVIKDGEKIYKNDLWQGMTKAMLLESRRVPLEYNRYSKGTRRLFGMKHNFYLFSSEP